MAEAIVLKHLEVERLDNLCALNRLAENAKQGRLSLPVHFALICECSFRKSIPE